MKYLVFAADCGAPNLRDEAVEEGDCLWQELSPALRDDILDWNLRYAPIVLMDTQSRLLNLGLIQELDQQGLELAARIAAELSPAKAKYYSEGLRRFLLP